MGRRWMLPVMILAAGAAIVWPLRHTLTAEALAARSPQETGLSVLFLLLLYGAKSFSVVFPLSALTAAGGLLFPLPLALTVNLVGTAVVQTLPYLLGRWQRADLAALQARYPRLMALPEINRRNSGRTVFLLRLGGAAPGDLMSLYLGAAGIPWQRYLVGGLLGAAPRVACATVLGAALWDIGGHRFWLSLAANTLLTALSALLWLWWRKGA